jgi:hypothetical protein
MKRKQSLKQAVRLARNGTLRVTACGLDGCPVGMGWPETQQAMQTIMEALPHWSERSYHTYDLIAALYREDSTGRYRLREAQA